MKLHPRILTSGRSCLDAVISPQVRVEFRPDNIVALHIPGAPHRRLIRYLGDPIEWGAKRTCASVADLEGVPCTIEPGGGAFNSAKHLRRSSRRVTVMDEVRCDATAGVIHALGGACWSIGRGDAGTVGGAVVNTVLRNSTGSRIILRHLNFDSPVECSVPVLARLGVRFDGVLINSMKCPAAAANLASQTAALKLPLTFVANNALPAGIEDHIMARAGLVICNFEEFGRIARRNGIATHTDEETPIDPDFAEAVSLAARRLHVSCLAITCGAAGTILHGPGGELLHLALTPSRRVEVSAAIARRHGGSNAAGDIAAAAFAAQFASNPALHGLPALRRLALLTHMEIIGSLAPQLHPHPNWFAIQEMTGRPGLGSGLPVAVAAFSGAL